MKKKMRTLRTRGVVFVVAEWAVADVVATVILRDAVQLRLGSGSGTIREATLILTGVHGVETNEVMNTVNHTIYCTIQ